MGITLARLFTLAGGGRSTFSFSSSSHGAGLSLIFLPDADIFILACSRAVLEALRCIPGVVGVAVGLADEERASDVSLVLVGGGVPRDARLCFRGGGPIEPVADFATMEPFERRFLVKVFIAVGAASVPRILSLPVSESAEGGLTMPGVAKAADESRRCAIFEG